MVDVINNGAGAAFKLITGSTEISQNLKNGLVGSMKAEDFKAGDLDYALKFMESRASSPNATPAEKELFKQLQTFKASSDNSCSKIDVDSAIKAVDTAKAPVTAATTDAAKAPVSVSDAVNGIVDQKPVGKDETGRKVDFAREGTPEGDWVKKMLTKLDPAAKDQNLSEAVSAYQKKNNLSRVDGKAGPETLRALLNDKNIEAGAKMSDKDTQKIFAHTPTEYPADTAKVDAKPAADKPKADKPKADKPKADTPTTDKPKADPEKAPERVSVAESKAKVEDAKTKVHEAHAEQLKHPSGENEDKLRAAHKELETAKAAAANNPQVAFDASEKKKAAEAYDARYKDMGTAHKLGAKAVDFLKEHVGNVSPDKINVERAVENDPAVIAAKQKVESASSGMRSPEYKKQAVSQAEAELAQALVAAKKKAKAELDGEAPQPKTETPKAEKAPVPTSGGTWV